jgi:signal transduction histidine kinase/CheY-like chemotaxis protein
MAFPDDLRKAAFDQAELPAAVLDLHGVLALWNPPFERLFTLLSGLRPERLTLSLFDFLESREGARLGYYAAEVLLGGRPSAAVESPVRAADGSRRWLRLVLSCIEAPSGAEPRQAGPAAPGPGQAERFLLCSVEDVTERVLREEGLRRAKDEAERATHTKSLFLANMSHEIRTPIQTILGVVELLRETELDTEQAEYASQVGFSADVLLGLINDVLDFSKIEAGRIELETTNFDLRACAYQSVDLLAMEAGRKGLEIVVDIAEDLPSLVRGDPLRLRQVIVNLLKNAVKFTREGGVRLTIGKAEQPSGQGIRVTVEDTGPGIPSAARERLFTPFYQADTQSARKSGGTGLGLAISRSIVEAMGGTIGVSAPEKPRAGGPGGEGIAFWFEVPLSSPDFTAPPRLPAARTGERLLVVDDHEMAREMAASVASRAGYDARTASSGEEALAALREAAREGAPFSLCLIDQSMPRMDGWRLASEITGDTSINAARLILMAGAGEISADAKMRLLRWFNGYLAKPVRPLEMLEALERALSSEVDLESAEAGVEGSGGKERRRFDADVLLAEDHDVNRELFTLLLERSGCRVFSARDGVEAVELSSKKRFDLVLMDIFMPRMSGYEAARAIRASGYDGPIVAVTASALKGDRDKCAEAGMNGILVKPFKREDLEEALGACLGGGTFAGSITEAPRPEAADPDRPPEVGGAAAAGASAAGPEVFDWEGVLDTFLGQEATVVGLLGRFIEKAGSQLDELSQALDSRDMTRFREIAHSLKGASWNLSARRLGDAALTGETAGREGDAEAAAWALGEIRASFEEFAAAAAPYAKNR